MVRQWQESFYGNRFSNSYMKNGMPNFSKLSQAYGLEGFEISNYFDLIKLMNDINQKEKSILIDVNVIENENCYPMVAPGRSNSQMLGLEQK
jgi:acetolactate synthase-1/2/3 large subunit